MEIFMRSIPFSVEQPQLKQHLANIFHSADFAHHSPQPLNFEVRIYRKATKRGTRNGTITVLTQAVGEQFLLKYSGSSSSNSVVVAGTRIRFRLSDRRPNSLVLRAIRDKPYTPPSSTGQRTVSLSGRTEVSIATLQFGWVCRDEEYSVEWEKAFTATRTSAHLTYNEDRREFKIECMEQSVTRIVAIRTTQIFWTGASPDQSGEPSIFFYLLHPPSFETDLPDPDPDMDSLAHVIAALNLTRRVRPRHTAYDDTHEPIARFTSLAVRLVCSDPGDIITFKSLCRKARTSVDSSTYPVVHRGLFASNVRDAYNGWVSTLDFPVAFQVEAILRGGLLDMRELVVTIRSLITQVNAGVGPERVGALLADFKARLEARLWYGDDVEVNQSTAKELFMASRTQFMQDIRLHASPTLSNPDLFYCYHLTLTASTAYLDGPFPERSNRVIRHYRDNQDCFLRVHFVDDNELAYRFDPEINLRDLVNRRVKAFLVNGVSVAGKHFQFLGYSQSALKSHSVWFVRPFVTPDGRSVSAATIIDSIGSFENNPYDSQLIYCPARYAARISQAFSATESSIAVADHEIEIIEDIKDRTGQYSFTDGNGTMSAEIAQDIAVDQRSRTRVRRGWRVRPHTYPRLMQVRIAGSKGMLHVDYQLEGRRIRLPRSMVKFQARGANQIEIAQTFEEPSRFYLNRPLIMILEGLGVPYTAFQRLQDESVRAARALTQSLNNSGWLLETYGLGNSFRLTSTLLALHRLGVGPFNENNFWQRMMTFAVNHVLRELKYHARIPVPDGWTLVGIADVHGQLNEGEIYTCVESPVDRTVKYLEGPTLITRSPAIHPGDVQVVRAIGRPPPGSHLDMGDFKNCVVFSTRGVRPLPSCLGGGDLDGDKYNVTTMRELLPPVHNLEDPASYTPAQRRTLERPSTMRDVADFVTEFIISDNVGMIASTWLILSDKAGIRDRDCLRLAELHNAAVDYPKTGNPVPINEIRPMQKRIRDKPDWYMPETSSGRGFTYYQSTSALGRLFRAIDLSALDDRTTETSYFEQPEIDEAGITFEQITPELHRRPERQRGMLPLVVQKVLKFVPHADVDDADAVRMWSLFTSYASRLRGICAAHAVSTSRSSMLSEEEVVIGTIAAKCAQARKRTDLTARMREQAATLVSGIRAEISGEEHTPVETHLQQAWTAYRLSCALSDYFGGQSFGWIALGEMFDAIREIEEKTKSNAQD